MYIPFVAVQQLVWVTNSENRQEGKGVSCVLCYYCHCHGRWESQWESQTPTPAPSTTTQGHLMLGHAQDVLLRSLRLSIVCYPVRSSWEASSFFSSGSTHAERQARNRVDKALRGIRCSLQKGGSRALEGVSTEGRMKRLCASDATGHQAYLPYNLAAQPALLPPMASQMATATASICHTGSPASAASALGLLSACLDGPAASVTASGGHWPLAASDLRMTLEVNCCANGSLRSTLSAERLAALSAISRFLQQSAH